MASKGGTNCKPFHASHRLPTLACWRCHGFFIFKLAFVQPAGSITAGLSLAIDSASTPPAGIVQ